MKKYRLINVLLVLLVYATSCNTNSSKSVDLKFKLPKGSKYEYSATTAMDMKQSENANDSSIRNETAFSYVFEVVNDSANWKTLTSTISRVAMDMNVMGHSIHVDTDMKLDTATPGPFAMMGKMFGAMKNAKFSFTINEKGEIGQISGIREMQEKMLSQLPGAPSGGRMPGMDDENLKQNMQQAFAVYPDKPVKPGDSWTKTLVQRMQGMTLKTENVFTLESVKGNDAAIGQETKINSDITSDSAQGVKITGSQKGTLHYNLSTGMITDGDLDMIMEVKNMMMQTEKPRMVNMKVKMKGREM